MRQKGDGSNQMTETARSRCTRAKNDCPGKGTLSLQAEALISLLGRCSSSNRPSPDGTASHNQMRPPQLGLQANQSE